MKTPIESCMAKTCLVLLTIILVAPLPGCSSNGNNQASEILTLLFEKDPPQFVALKDGNDNWEAQTVQSGKMELAVKDASKNYGVVVFGWYGGISQGKGFFFQSNLDDINRMSFRFDDTGTSITHTISGTASNQNGPSYLVAGTSDYRNYANYRDVTTPGAFSVNYTWDADGFTQGDVLFLLDHGGLNHYKKQTVTFTNHVASGVDYTATPSDSGNTFSADHGAIRLGTDYDGLGVKFQGLNLKALLENNVNTGDTETFDKFSSGADDLFSVSANWSYTGSSYNTSMKYVQYFKNPATVSFDTKPTAPPSVSVDADAGSTIRFTFGSLYSGNLGLNDIARGARIKTADTQWNMYQTHGRYSAGNLTMSFDIDLTSLMGFPLNKEPIQSGSDIRVSYYQSSMGAQDWVDRQLSAHRPASKYDNSRWLRLSHQF